MKKLNTLILTTLLSLNVLTLGATITHAADMMKDDSMMMKDDKMMDHGMMKNEVAIGGFCPVCLLHGMEMKGSDDFVTEHKGKIYKFSSKAMQKAFENDPERYSSQEVEAKYEAMRDK